MAVIAFIALLFFYFAAFQASFAAFPEGEDAKKTVPELIQKYYGQDCEEHFVKSGKYNLTLHRIPFKGAPSDCKGIAFLHHGLFGNSFHWVSNSNESSLAYVLASKNYDVWLGNGRGNLYSRVKDEESFKATDKYWDFSFHEMGSEDIPKVIAYIGEQTNKLNHAKVDYIGHSMGCAMIFIRRIKRVAISRNPEWANKTIRSVSALAPAVLLGEMKNKLCVLTPLTATLQTVSEMCHFDSLVPSTKCVHLIDCVTSWASKIQIPFHSTLAGIWGTVAAPVKELFYSLLGVNPEIMRDPVLVSVMKAHMRDVGTSTKTLFHLVQLHKSNKFQEYDDSPSTGRSPKAYDLNGLSIPPIGLFFGKADTLVDYEDVQRLHQILKQNAKIVQIGGDTYNHLDFTCDPKNFNLLVPSILKFLDKPTEE